MFKRIGYTLALCACLLSQHVYSHATDAVFLEEALIFELQRGDGSNVIAPDGIAALVETGQWSAPAENEEVRFNGTVIGTWRKISADEEGWFRARSLRNAYVYFQYPSDRDEIILLEGMGHEMAYVNGAPRSGNPYGSKDEYEDWETKFDYSLIPVRLNEGMNELLFKCSRGYLKVKIHTVGSGLVFNEKDVTKPDLRAGQAIDAYGAIPVINATEQSYTDVFVKSWAEGAEPAYHAVRRINPLAVHKTPFHIALPAVREAGMVKLHIELVQKTAAGEKVLSSSTLELNVVSEGESYRETFVSGMDGSVQYYGVHPPAGLNGAPALFLTLHGAGVEAINQVRSYETKNWGYLVAPTNRRPYGYNWENWGRLDALEVLDIALSKFGIDKNRVYLTGHSMGGHGTWHLGINYPDRFAALGPSAGWISIWGYRINPNVISGEVGHMLVRSAKQSDTYALATNLAQTGVYAIHGDADDIVSPEQSRSMIETISPFHHDYVYYEEPGAGHWWDNSGGDGADCVDWMPMFDYFARRSVPGKQRVKMINFATANPAISSKNNWIEIIHQIEQQKISRIEIRVESSKRLFVGATENIELLALDASMLPHGESVSIELDGQVLSDLRLSSDRMFYLLNNNGVWESGDRVGTDRKHPARTGNFREALNHNVVFVYGTHGTDEENRWAYEKARFDAEVTWYQGNGAIEVIPDAAFEPAQFRDRNVILFGNANTNSAWRLLLDDSPVQVKADKIVIGDNEYAGSDLAGFLIRPRSDSDVASVGAVTGTGIAGMRLANLAPYHHPYVSLPDVVVYDSGILESDEQGVRFAGYFGNDWSLERGEFVRQ